jgi:Holliday junction resolvase
MSRRSRDKGARIEREIANLHRAAGIGAERVPLSGAAGGLFVGDLVVDGLGRAEVKARADGAGFATIERWLANHDALFLRRDRAAPLVLLPWAVYLRLLLLARGQDNV